MIIKIYAMCIQSLCKQVTTGCSLVNVKNILKRPTLPFRNAQNEDTKQTEQYLSYPLFQAILHRYL